MPTVVGIRFKKAGKIYYFDPALSSVTQGDHAIVETARGVEYGEVVVARDVLLWQNGLEEQIYNCDCTDRLRRLAASWPASHLKQAADIAQQAYQAIESNAGAKLVLETVVLKTDILRKEER